MSPYSIVHMYGDIPPWQNPTNWGQIGHEPGLGGVQPAVTPGSLTHLAHDPKSFWNRSPVKFQKHLPRQFTSWEWYELRYQWYMNWHRSKSKHSNHLNKKHSKITPVPPSLGWSHQEGCSSGPMEVSSSSCGYPQLAGWFLSWKIPSRNGWLGVPPWLWKPPYSN